MAWSFVRASTAALAAGSTATVNVPAPSTAGNRLFLVILAWATGSTAPGTTTVTDPRNGAWHNEGAQGGVAGTGRAARLVVWSVQANTALQTGDLITINFTLAIGGGQVGLLEYAGLSTATASLDVSSGALGTSTAPSSGTTAATTGTSELALACFGDDKEGNTWTAAPPGTARVNHMGDSTNADLWVSERDSGAQGSTLASAGTLATSAWWAMLTLIYKLGPVIASATGAAGASAGAGVVVVAGATAGAGMAGSLVAETSEALAGAGGAAGSVRVLVLASATAAGGLAGSLYAPLAPVSPPTITTTLTLLPSPVPTITASITPALPA